MPSATIPAAHAYRTVREEKPVRAKEAKVVQRLDDGYAMVREGVIDRRGNQGEDIVDMRDVRTFGTKDVFDIVNRLARK